jgi:hypothetical protein
MIERAQQITVCLRQQDVAGLSDFDRYDLQYDLGHRIASVLGATCYVRLVLREERGLDVCSPIPETVDDSIWATVVDCVRQWQFQSAKLALLGQ